MYREFTHFFLIIFSPLCVPVSSPLLSSFREISVAWWIPGKLSLLAVLAECWVILFVEFLTKLYFLVWLCELVRILTERLCKLFNPERKSSYKREAEIWCGKESCFFFFFIQLSCELYLCRYWQNICTNACFLEYVKLLEDQWKISLPAIFYILTVYFNVFFEIMHLCMGILTHCLVLLFSSLTSSSTTVHSLDVE